MNMSDRRSQNVEMDNKGQRTHHICARARALSFAQQKYRMVCVCKIKKAEYEATEAMERIKAKQQQQRMDEWKWMPNKHA